MADFLIVSTMSMYTLQDQLRQILGRVIYDSGIPERIRIPEQIPNRIWIPEQIPVNDIVTREKSHWWKIISMSQVQK